MKPSFSLPSLRQVIGLAVAGTAIFCAGGASAQTLAPFNFEVDNYTFSGGDPVFQVTDDLTFSNLQINEVYQDNTAVLVSMADLDTGAFSEATPFAFDGTHGFLKTATLTGSLTISGFLPTSTLGLTLQPTLDPASQVPQTVVTRFSTVLNAPQPGVNVGQFSLLFNGTPLFAPTNITVAPIPEASTIVSLGIMLALGLGALVASRRRCNPLAE